MAGISLNSNLSALGAQRRLTQHSAALGKSLDRLSSGLRINHAGDDAAGLAVSSLLNNDRRVFNQAVRNINDGVSYLNVAEGSMAQLSNVVTRIRELAEQSANGVLGSSQRDALQREVTALENEFNRIIDSTSFNGNTLLTGAATKVLLTGGYGTNAQLNVQIGEASLDGRNDYSAAGNVLVSQSSGGIEGDDHVLNLGGISADGRYVLFASPATNLIANDTNGLTDVFVRDTLLNTTTLVTSKSNGVQSGGDTGDGVISADGRYVALITLADDLVDNDTNNATDIFLKDLVTGSMTRVSVSSAGAQADFDSSSPALSADGRYVVFTSSADNLITNETNFANDIYIRDTVLNTTRIVSRSTLGETDGDSDAASVSADGRYIAFQSNATNLVTGDTNSAADVFVKDMQTGSITRVSTATGGAQATGISVSPKISADGRYVVFLSTASNLVSGDTNGQADIFVRDLLLGTTRRVNVTSTGAQATGGGSDNPNISADGRYISYASTATNLTPEANADGGIFVYDMVSGTTRRADLALDGSSGNDSTGGRTFLSADGRFIAYTSLSSNLVTPGTGYSNAFRRDLSVAGVQRISGMLVSDQASARITLDLAKRYQEEISKYQAGIGASVSRAGAFVSTLQTASENFAAAASQITDVDVPEETAKLVSSQILQGATTAVLAQANRQPELALTLLGSV